MQNIVRVAPTFWPDTHKTHWSEKNDIQTREVGPSEQYMNAALGPSLGFSNTTGVQSPATNGFQKGHLKAHFLNTGCLHRLNILILSECLYHLDLTYNQKRWYGTFNAWPN